MADGTNHTFGELQAAERNATKAPAMPSHVRRVHRQKSEASTLDMLCEIYNIRTLPKNPAEELSGLLSEFNIKESAVDIIRDVRDNP